jgi:DNA-binding Lrp family transcriptional regulator
MKELKEIDKKLLNLIQEESMAVPRVTRIANKLGLPVTTVKTKLDKFAKLGIIKGYSAIIDPDKVDKSLVAFWFGKIPKGVKKPAESVLSRMMEVPQVQEVFFISGEWDFIVKARLKDHKEYYHVAAELAKRYEEQSGMGVFAPKTFKDTHKIMVE